MPHFPNLASGSVLLAAALSLNGCGSDARSQPPVVNKPSQTTVPVDTKTSTRPDAVGPKEAIADAMRRLNKDADRQAYRNSIDEYMDAHRTEISLRNSLIDAEKKHRASDGKIPPPQEVPGYADLQIAIEKKANSRSQIELLSQMHHLKAIGWDLVDAEALASKGKPSRSNGTLFQAAHDQVEADLVESDGK